MHNIKTVPMSSVEATLNQHWKASLQPFLNNVKCRVNVEKTLSQLCFNVASTSAEAIAKSISLVKSMDLKKD